MFLYPKLVLSMAARSTHNLTRLATVNSVRFVYCGQGARRASLKLWGFCCRICLDAILHICKRNKINGAGFETPPHRFS